MILRTMRYISAVVLAANLGLMTLHVLTGDARLAAINGLAALLVILTRP